MGVYEQLFDDEESLKMVKREHEKIGLQKGIEQGREQGIEQGREEHKAEIVRTIRSKGKTPEEISELTDIPLDEVEAILSETS